MSGRRRVSDALVHAAVALYRLALRRYPAALRDRFGARMVTDFRVLLEEEVERRGIRGWAGACARVAWDLTRPLPARIAAEAASPLRWSASWASALRDVGEDVRSAARSLRRRPGFTLLIVGILGAGIALNAVMFAVVEAYLLRPLPFPAPDRLVQVRPATPAVGWDDSDDVFEAAASWSLGGFTLVGDPGPDVVLGARITADFFGLHGVVPVLGRGFTREEARPGGPAVAVVSHDLWMRRFAGDPSVLGRTLRAYHSDAGRGLESFTVIGVLPRDFWYLNGYTNVLVPLREPAPARVARLRGDVPRWRAEEVLTARAWSRGALSDEETGVRLLPLQDAYTASVRLRLLALQSAALLVLLAASASAGLLLLIRAHGRRGEMGIRRALGAAERRLATHVFAEGGILAAFAGVVGLALAWMGSSVLSGLIETRIGRSVPGGTAALHPDLVAVAVVVLLVALIGAGLGSIPLWATTRKGLCRVVSARTGTEGTTARRVRAALVAAEVAFALTLLSGGALLVRTALHLQRIDLGFDPQRLEAYTVGLTTEGAEDPQRRIAFFRALVERAAELPGVESVGAARAAPFAGSLTAREIEVEGGAGAPGLPEVVPQIVSSGFFATLGARPVQGRLTGQEDGPEDAPVAVVSEALAAALSAGGDVLGTRVRFRDWNPADMSQETGPWLTVVGVVPDLSDGLAGARPTLYVPHSQAPTGWMALVLRRRPGTADLAEPVRALVRELDDETPLYAEADIPAAVAEARAPSRFFAALLLAFSLFSLGLAVVGLYGVAAYAARQRRRDLAVRLALGARRASVEILCLRDSVGALAVGLTLGLMGGRLLGTVLEAQLHGVRPDDAASALVMAATVATTALLAVWLPARRAARLDVSSILREE